MKMADKIRLTLEEKVRCKKLLVQNIRQNNSVLKDRVFMETTGLEFIESAYRLMKACKEGDEKVINKYYKLMLNKFKPIALHFDLEIENIKTYSSLVSLDLIAAPYNTKCAIVIK